MRLPQGLGRTVFIAGLAGGIFAGFLLVTPKLAITDAASAPADDEVTTTSAPPATTSSSSSTTTTTTTTTTTPAATTSEPFEEPVTPELGYDGTVRLTATVAGPLGGKAWAFISDGDQITWRFHVVNTTDQELWGVFVWLELEGRAACGDHHLWPMGETDCYLTTTAYSGELLAEAWVNAWTTTRQVKDKVFHTLRVVEY